MPVDHFGPDVATRYDASPQDAAPGGEFDPAVISRTVDVLAELVAGGAALELAVGTGRIAVPLHARGVPVDGVDLSPAMLAQLRAKPGAVGIGVTVGDMSTVRLPGRYALAYLVFNTIGNLTTQDDQVACFITAAHHLDVGGLFVVEVGVPDLQRLPPGETVRPFLVEPAALGFDEYDVVAQGLVSHHYRVVDGALVQASVPFRYVWPAELDLMARLAGMRVVARWDGWDRAPFTAASRAHVSVWEKTGPQPAPPH